MAHHVQAYYLPSHRDNPEVLSSPEDVDALVDRLLDEPIEHSLASLYVAERQCPGEMFPDHELNLGVDRNLKVGALKYADPDGNWATLGTTDGGYYCLMGTETPFPPNANLPLDLVRQAVKEFLASGGQRPTSVRWQDDII